MRQVVRHMVVLCSLLLALVSMSTFEAHAASRPVPVTASDKYALKLAGAGGFYVSAEVDNTGGTEGMLRARTSVASPEELGSWEKFTLHTDDKGVTLTLRSEANGNYVTTERNYTGTHQNLLRARGTTVGEWEKLRLEKQSDGTYALRAMTNDGYRYVTAEMNDAGGDKGLLRARSDTIGSWQKFELVYLAEENASDEGPRPAPVLPAQETSFRVMSWNVCANHNGKCSNHRVEGDDLGAQIVNRMGDRVREYRAVFLQELCEAHAKPIELELEAVTGTGWDVRFAPVKFDVDGSTVKAARTCDNAGSAETGWKDRGSYGIALAVPDSNVWYTSYDLPSPENRTVGNKWQRIEQRTGPCAVLPGRALQFCTAHFSAGVAEDDPDGEYRRQQAAKLQEIVHGYTPAGYRTVYGGDFNAVPTNSASPDNPKDVMTSAYQADTECDENLWAERPFDGRATKPIPTDDGTYRYIKIDYLFAPSNATVLTCGVLTDTGRSDHYPIQGHFRLPAQ
ncbi:hypothetical protein SUDANB176_01028 [Streptomyces sp. enrichment culture]|uniref:endonuclease/exonuclease/phosphatase family protein n=1 Tax=Streptomyces sp. enrichment culture TaxID=1795815 RepID=UPI003F54587F